MSRKEYLQWSVGLYARRQILKSEETRTIIRTRLIPPVIAGFVDGWYFWPDIPNISVVSLFVIGANYWALKKFLSFEDEFRPSISYLQRLEQKLTQENVTSIREEYVQFSKGLPPPSYRSYQLAFKFKDEWVKKYIQDILEHQSHLSDLSLVKKDLDFPDEISRVLCGDE